MNDGMLRFAATPAKSYNGFSSHGSLAQVRTTGRRDLPGDVTIDAIPCCQALTMSQSVLTFVGGCRTAADHWWIQRRDWNLLTIQPLSKVLRAI